jgi:5-methylcytosine-specific restriction protein A
MWRATALLRLRVLKPCLDCGRLVPVTTKGARCPECQAKRYSGSRLKPGGSGWEWGRLRANVLAAQPWCVVCAAAGKQTLAVTVDHRIARINGGSDDLSNLMSMCKAHHDAKHWPRVGAA